MDTLPSRLTSLHQKSEDTISIGYEQVAISFATRSVAAVRTRQKMLATYRENPEATAFNKLIFRSIPEEKNLDKLPPPENQSPKLSDSEDMDHDHKDQGGDRPSTTS